jgi:hypothetical protein
MSRNAPPLEDHATPLEERLYAAPLEEYVPHLKGCQDATPVCGTQAWPWFVYLD